MRVYRRQYRMLDGTSKTLVSKVGDGSIIKRFDMTPLPKSDHDVVCPHFLELKWATGCPYSCAWCYLQGTFRFLEYKTRPRAKAFDRIEKHVLAFIEGDGIRPEILNSGELSDSLITERRTKPFSRFVTDLLDGQRKHRVLFVTKSPEIGNIIGLRDSRNVIVSFSLNAQEVASTWERAPSVEDRIEAAGILKDCGLEVRVRIDPMVPVDNWADYYVGLLESIFERLVPDRITIGSLRGLQSTINNSKDRSWTNYLQERSNWGLKIPIRVRTEMYHLILDTLREDYKYTKVALCKETRGVWDQLALDYRHIRCNCTQ